MLMFGELLPNCVEGAGFGSEIETEATEQKPIKLHFFTQKRLCFLLSGRMDALLQFASLQPLFADCTRTGTESAFAATIEGFIVFKAIEREQVCIRAFISEGFWRIKAVNCLACRYSLSLRLVWEEKSLEK